MKSELMNSMKEIGERVLITEHNPISIALTLDNLKHQNQKDITYFGSILWSR